MSTINALLDMYVRNAISRAELLDALQQIGFSSRVMSIFREWTDYQDKQVLLLEAVLRPEQVEGWEPVDNTQQKDGV